MFWFVFCGEDLLLTNEFTLPRGETPPVEARACSVIRLPELEGEECRTFCAAPPFPETLKPLNLRKCFRVLPAAHYAMAGKARELLYWDANSKYCGVCGGPMRFHTDISKRCEHCGKEVWPPLAIASIVAVSRGDKILLVQSRNFRADFMGLVAGFVETGESLEECVRREVREEVGIEITNLRYFGSQTWPYPCGLMAGFHADYAGGEIKLQCSELRKGGWYGPDELPRLPGKMSLARLLIDDWLRQIGREDVEVSIVDF